MIKKREKCKKELLQLTIEILDKRYDMEDYSGSNLAHAEAQKAPRPVFYPLYHDQYSKVSSQNTFHVIHIGNNSFVLRNNLSPLNIISCFW